MTAPDFAIRLEGVSKSFDGRVVLDDVSIEVGRGQAFCLLGRSGTGKSVTLRRQELSEARKGMGFLFQDAALFDSMSVRENVAFPLRRHTDLPEHEIQDRVRAKLAAVGLERDLDKMPSELSGGMRKRVGLARAMALDPSILLVDEPSAGLDPITTREIDELLANQRNAGKTLVVVTHNIPSARMLGDELAILHEGRIVTRGSAEVLDRSEHAVVRAFMRSEGGG